METMVESFSRLTLSGLSDYNLYEEVLDNHFEKFREFYYISRVVSSDIESKIKSIECSCTDTTLNIVLAFTSEKNCKKYKEAIEPHLVPDDEEHFDFSVQTKSSKKLNISLENKNISREDEIYEDRFDSH